MLRSELVKLFLDFFKAEGHKVIPSSSLVPENDPTVLFTTAGMQQFKRYYLFPDEAPSGRIVTCQKCVRTGDIDEVGDETHLTFFEMLGNFSFGYPQKEGSYFKKEAIEMAWEFLTGELKVEKSRIYATYFKDDAKEVPEDKESLEILQKIDGLTDIRPQGFDDNFWSLGTENSPGGPTVEFYVDNVEIWNLVFNEFVMKDGKYEPSEFKGVDTGMGLERLAAVMQSKADVYETDTFVPIIEQIEKISGKKYGDDKKSFRIIADHLRSAIFMIADGVEPSNKDRGYILRRLIRRAIVKGKQIGIEKNFCADISSAVISSGVKESLTGHSEPDEGEESPANAGNQSRIRERSLHFGRDDIRDILNEEEVKFRETLERGLKKLEKMSKVKIGTQWSGGQIEWKDVEIFADNLFDLFQEDGIPLEVALEEARKIGIKVAEESSKQTDIMCKIKEKYDLKKRAHQNLSRTASAGMFKGGLADNKIETTRLHTAAHLLLAALREVLGEQVEQKGSNITEERLRFDFNNPEKLAPEQIEKVENIVNEKIDEGLPVVMQEMDLEEAKKSGATGSFSDRYGDIIKIYTIGAMEKPFSREICGGPHVSNTNELGHFKITKEESSSAGVRRIKAILE